MKNNINTSKLIIENTEDEEMIHIYIHNGYDRIDKKKTTHIFEGNYWDFAREPSAIHDFLKQIFKKLKIEVPIEYKKIKEPE